MDRYRVAIETRADQATEDIFLGRPTKDARRAVAIPLQTIAIRKLAILDHATKLGMRRIPSSDRPEVLGGDRKRSAFHSGYEKTALVFAGMMDVSRVSTVKSSVMPGEMLLGEFLDPLGVAPARPCESNRDARTLLANCTACV